MKKTILGVALSLGFVLTPAFAQSTGQDLKDAAHDTKTETKKGYKKSTKEVKKGYKKSTHATKKGVHKAADKVADKTKTD